MKFLIKFVLFAVAVYLSASFVPGIDVAGVKGALIVSVVLGLLNAFVKPVCTDCNMPLCYKLTDFFGSTVFLFTNISYPEGLSSLNPYTLKPIRSFSQHMSSTLRG